MKKWFLSGLACCALLCGCTSSSTDFTTRSGLHRSQFQTSVDGDSTDLYVLTNQAGMEVCITNFGGRVVSILAPDRKGELKDVVLGFDNIHDYVKYPHADFGATIGQFANRIARGKFVLEGDTIQLPLNNNGNTLHGGPKGWQARVFKARQISPSMLELSRVSPAGEENFPGNVTVTVVFTLREDNALAIHYQAVTDQTTIINMTNHSYFNLSGDPTLPATEQELMIHADQFSPIDTLFIPLGSASSVEGTPMDFRVSKLIGKDIDAENCEQLKNGRGYDHNWILKTEGDTTQVAARLYSPQTGITLEVYTNEPGLQVYSGNFLDGEWSGKQGIPYHRRTAVCLETQHFPDSPNHADWPTVVLKPTETYRSVCIYKFLVQ